MSYINDFSHAIFQQDTLYPQTITANTNGASVDLALVGGNTISASLSVGSVSGTSPTLSVKLQSSADNSTWADIPGAVFPTVTASGANTRQVLQVTLPRPDNTGTAAPRYVRAVATVGGTSPSYVVNCEIMGLRKHPQAALGAVNTPPAIN
jgi:hypothetical protein